MKTTTKTFSFLLSIFAFAATAQPISISGKVTDKSGSPISGAIVALVRQGLMDTTGADGAFLLAKSSATAAPAMAPAADVLLLRGGVLKFVLTHSAVVKIHVFDVRGRLLKRLFLPRVSAGDYSFDVSEKIREANLLIVHVSIGSNETTFSLFPLSKGIFTMKLLSGGSVASHHNLAKAALTVDTLRITAAGYRKNEAAISTYDSVVTIALDKNPDMAGNWRLERATCTTEGSDSCRVGLQLCPSFYCFSGSRLTMYQSSYSVMCTRTSCDTTVHCYDTLKKDFTKVNDTTYQCWGDDIIIGFKNDTLVFRRIMMNMDPASTKTYYFVREIQPVPYCSRECVGMGL